MRLGYYQFDGVLGVPGVSQDQFAGLFGEVVEFPLEGQLGDFEGQQLASFVVEQLLPLIVYSQLFDLLLDQKLRRDRKLAISP